MFCINPLVSPGQPAFGVLHSNLPDFAPCLLSSPVSRGLFDEVFDVLHDADRVIFSSEEYGG